MILSRKRSLKKLSFYIFGLILHERNHRFSACIIIFHTSSIHARGNCSRKWEKCMEVRVGGWFSALCPVWRKLGGTCFRSCFCLVVKRDGENKFLVRARKFWRNVERRDATNLVKLFFFFTANLGSAKIPSICENPSWNTNRVS